MKMWYYRCMTKTFYTEHNRIDVITADDSGVFKEYGKVFYILCAESVLIHPLKDAAVVMVYPYEWSYRMTPIKALSGRINNTGGGKEYAESFKKDVMNTAEEYLGFIGGKRILAGYSLGGIEALYICKEYPKGTFNGVASVSGSLWYENIAECFMEAAAEYTGIPVYFSLGDKESKSRTHAAVEKNIQALYEKISRYTQAVFVKESGGHFDNIPDRIEHMISFFYDV